MKTVTLRNKQRAIKLFLFCFFFLVCALAATIVDASPAAPATRDFWVGPRKAHATLRASGERTLLYVEDKLFGHQLSPDFLNRLEYQLETAPPSTAFATDAGLVPLEERIFGTLPARTSHDDRLVVLFADLSQLKGASLDGLFSATDQLPDAVAMQKFQQHSNESNLVYVNGFRKTEAYTTAVVARELQHLLSSRPESPREGWLEETLAEGALLLSGLFADQPHVEQYSASPGRYPLVTPGAVSFGPQTLFSSFLLDTLPLAHGTAVGALNAVSKNGRDAVEELELKLTDVPLNFDAIFSNYVSYVFSQAEGAVSLPAAWRHSPGVQVPKITSYATYRAGAGSLNGVLAPYSFVAIDLEQELSPSARIQLERVPPANGPSSASCAASASVLWKPVSQKRLAVYAVGCDPSGKVEDVQFRLRILDQPSLLPTGPFTLLR